MQERTKTYEALTPFMEPLGDSNDLVARTNPSLHEPLFHK